MLHAVDYRDLAFRALHTFWQTFAVLFVMPDNVWDAGAWQSVAAAAIAAGLSAVKTFISDWLRSQQPDE
jgi:hypothetical protein